jgi:asparagine synthase (glutamine-hydrolysing)
VSGIVGILRTDGKPVERHLIAELTGSLSFRGPDAQRFWCDGPVAFGHSLLRTTSESACERQPVAIQVSDHPQSRSEIVVVADARIDARAELLAKMDAPELKGAPDVELILRAYLKWGESAVEHLLGDFAFAVWDGPKQRLFCARDHMGVKPFYYAQVGPWLLFSNTLECLRRHPGVSDRLDDLAVADFLLFGCNHDKATTTYHDIRRLPPAHTLIWSSQKHGQPDLRRYWSLPIDEPVYYKRDRDYIEGFNELLEHAVNDRLRVDKVGVFMSGGLDSTLLAATARRTLGGNAAAEPVKAFTYVYESVISDTERGYADAAARHLGIPISFYGQDQGLAASRAGSHNMPEPLDTIADRRSDLRSFADMAAHSRVAFYGEGPDNALQYEWRPHLAHLLERRRWRRIVADVSKHVRRHKRLPLVATVPRMIRSRHVADQYEPVFPTWLNPDLVARLDLRERWRSINASPISAHPVRPAGYSGLLLPLWQSIFESSEPGYTGVPLEVRHPYVDIRLLRFMLSVPALPWCREKHLVRCAAHGILPEVVRSRPKTPLNGRPECERGKQHGVPAVYTSEQLQRYADVSKLSQSLPRTVGSVQSDLLLVAFSYWLRDRELVGAYQREDEHDEIGNEAGARGR